MSKMYSLNLPYKPPDYNVMMELSDENQDTLLCHSSTFTLSGKLGRWEKLPFLIISILRFFISKVFSSSSILSSLPDIGKSTHIISNFTSSLLMQNASIKHNTSTCKTAIQLFREIYK